MGSIPITRFHTVGDYMAVKVYAECDRCHKPSSWLTEAYGSSSIAFDGSARICKWCREHLQGLEDLKAMNKLLKELQDSRPSKEQPMADQQPLSFQQPPSFSYVSLIPTLIPIITAALTALTPTVQDYLIQHPNVFAIVFAGYSVLTHWLPSPAAKK